MKYVLFDLDGTLIDTSEGITKSAQYALEQFGIKEADASKLTFFVGPPLTHSFMTHYGMNQEEAEEAIKAYRSRYLPIGIYECQIYPHVREAILELKKRGYGIAVASSKPEPSCEIVLEHCGIKDLFDDICGSTFDGRIHSKQDVLEEVFRRHGDVSKNNMVLIGDTMFDVEGANSVGLASIAVSFGFGDEKEMLAAGAKTVCYDFLELPDLVDEVLKNEA